MSDTQVYEPYIRALLGTDLQVSVNLALRLVFFQARYKLYKARKTQAPDRSKVLDLESASILLFDGASPKFLEAVIPPLGGLFGHNNLLPPASFEREPGS